MDEPVPACLDTLPEPQRAIARRVFKAVRTARPDLHDAMKWGKPTFALDGDFHHWICQIGATNRAVGLTFHFGALLDDTSGVFTTGTSPYLRKAEYLTVDEVDAAIIADLVTQAVGTVDRFKASLATR